jgi:hypothetical protein
MPLCHPDQQDVVVSCYCFPDGLRPLLPTIDALLIAPYNDALGLESAFELLYGTQVMTRIAIAIPRHLKRGLIGLLPPVIPPHLISIDIPTVTNAVEEDAGALDIIANAVITYSDSPLADPYIGQLAASIGSSCSSSEASITRG